MLQGGNWIQNLKAHSKEQLFTINDLQSIKNCTSFEEWIKEKSSNEDWSLGLTSQMNDFYHQIKDKEKDAIIELHKQLNKNNEKLLQKMIEYKNLLEKNIKSPGLPLSTIKDL